jgi:hypothetical protein
LPQNIAGNWYESAFLIYFFVFCGRICSCGSLIAGGVGIRPGNRRGDVTALIFLLFCLRIEELLLMNIADSWGLPIVCTANFFLRWKFFYKKSRQTQKYAVLYI